MNYSFLIVSKNRQKTEDNTLHVRQIKERVKNSYDNVICAVDYFLSFFFFVNETKVLRLR